MFLGFVQLTMPLCILYAFVMYLSDNTVDISYLTILCFCLYPFSSIIGLMLTYIRGRNWLPDNKQYQGLCCVWSEIQRTILINYFTIWLVPHSCQVKLRVKLSGVFTTVFSPLGFKWLNAQILDVRIPVSRDLS